MKSTAKRLMKNTLNLSAASLGYHRWSSRQPRLWILMYHRILPETDPRFALEEPGMLVTPESFQSHLDLLNEFFQIMPLNEWLQRARQGKSLPAKAAAVTFDDGWLDNYEYAFPILQSTSTPATIFAVADLVGTSKSFWPNRVARILRNHLSGLRDLPDAKWLTKTLPPDQTIVDREQLARSISICKALSDDEIESRLDSLETKLHAKSENVEMANWPQLQEMATSQLVEIGSHTCTHRRLLPNLDPNTAHNEIVNSQKKLERELGLPIPLFCYPNGDTSPLAVKLVQKHYQGAVTTHRGINDASTPAHQLHRIGIHEQNANSRLTFQARLSGWRI